LPSLARRRGCPAGPGFQPLPERRRRQARRRARRGRQTTCLRGHHADEDGGTDVHGGGAREREAERPSSAGSSAGGREAGEYTAVCVLARPLPPPPATSAFLSCASLQHRTNDIACVRTYTPVRSLWTASPCLSLANPAHLCAVPHLSRSCARRPVSMETSESTAAAEVGAPCGAGDVAVAGAAGAEGAGPAGEEAVAGVPEVPIENCARRSSALGWGEGGGSTIHGE